MNNSIWIDWMAFTLPCIVMFVAVYIVIQKFMSQEDKKRYYELRANNQKAALPIRLQAYERLTLLMERLSVNNLILRVKKPGMTAAELQAELLAEIRAEFDHNLSQQVYISNEAWQFIIAARESVIKMINYSYSSIGPNTSGMDLSKSIFEAFMKDEPPTTYRAIMFLKKEAQGLF